jgi:hypothetical protein
LVERRSPKPNAGGSSPSTPAKGLPLAAIALALLAALPFAFAVRPQMADYPSHLARYHIMLDGGQSPFLAKYYSFDWALSGNLGVDLLMVPLGLMLGVESAAQLISVLLPVLVALGIVAVEWTLRGRIGMGGLLALATVWSPSMTYGFANFSLALALALFAFALWVRLRAGRLRAAAFVAIGMVVWLCHSAGWGVLGVMVFGYEWHRRHDWRALVAPWPLFPPFVLIALAQRVEGTFRYGNDPVMFKLGIWVKALAETNVGLDLLSMVILGAAIGLALLQRRIDGRLGWAALLVALLSLAIPRHLGGGDLADARLVPVALMLGCLSIEARPPRWVLWLAPALFVVRLAATSVVWHENSVRLESALSALDSVPHGARVAAAVPYLPRTWNSAPLTHTGSYATLYRDALVNTHFALPGVHMLTVKGMGEDFIDPSQLVIVEQGRKVDLSDFAPAVQADYLWYVGDIPVGALPDGARVIHRAPGTLLVRLAKPANRR